MASMPRHRDPAPSHDKRSANQTPCSASGIAQGLHRLASLFLFAPSCAWSWPTGRQAIWTLGAGSTLFSSGNQPFHDRKGKTSKHKIPGACFCCTHPCIVSGAMPVTAPPPRPSTPPSPLQHERTVLARTGFTIKATAPPTRQTTAASIIVRIAIVASRAVSQGLYVLAPPRRITHSDPGADPLQCLCCLRRQGHGTNESLSPSSPFQEPPDTSPDPVLNPLLVVFDNAQQSNTGLSSQHANKSLYRLPPARPHRLEATE